MVVYTYQHSGKLRQESFHFEVNLGYICQKDKTRDAAQWQSTCVACTMALGSMVSRKRKEKEWAPLENSLRNPKAAVPERAWCFVYKFMNA